jgi:hypothetical protein
MLISAIPPLLPVRALNGLPPNLQMVFLLSLHDEHSHRGEYISTGGWIGCNLAAWLGS